MASSEIKMKMSLDSSGVTKALTKAKAGIKSFAASAKEKLGDLAKVGIPALAAGFGLAAKGALAYAKEMKNLSVLANTSFEDFQRLAAGAKTAGISQEKLADIYKDTSDKVGDFLETGGGAMADYFENIAPKIGQTAEEFRNLSGPEALQKYYNGLQEANVSQETMTFYMEAIASDSVALVPLLKNGGKAFDELGDAAERNGEIMEKATGDRLAAASIELDKFKTKVTIWAGETASAIADAWNELKRMPVDTPIDFEDVGRRNAARKEEAVSVRELADAYGELSEGSDLSKLIDDLADLKTEQDTFLMSEFEVSNLTEAERAIVSAAKEMDKLKKDLAAGTISAEDFAFSQGMILDILKLEGDETRKLAKAAKDKAAAAKEAIELAEHQRQLILTHGTNEEKLIELQKQRLEIQEKLAKGAGTSEKASKEHARTKGELIKVDRAILTTQKKITTEWEKTSKEVEKTREEAFKLMMELEKVERVNAAGVNLSEALIGGDDQMIRSAEQQLAYQERILDVRNQLTLSHKEVEIIVDREIAKLREKEGIQADLIDAQIAQRQDIVHEIEKKIALEERAEEIQKRTNKGMDESIELAKKLIQIEAGQDLNQSGFVTDRERKKWLKDQEAVQKVQDDINRQERRDEMELGGGIENVSDKRRAIQRTDRADRRKAAADDRARRRDNAELARRKRRGEDEDAVKAEIAKRKEKKKTPEQVAAEIAADQAEADKERKKADPKKPENVVIKELKPILEDQLAELISINAALKCDG